MSEAKQCPSAGQEEYKELLPLEAIPEEKLVRATLCGYDLCLLRMGDRVYCFSNVCTHIGGRLSDGRVSRKTHVICPEHHAIFDAETGRSISFPRRNLRTFEVKVKDGAVHVKLGGDQDQWREELPSLKSKKYVW